MPNVSARRDIIRKVLLDGAAWEESSAQMLATFLYKTSPKKKKSRLGAKKVKQMENLESIGDELKPTEATNYRALAARANYLAQDRMDIAFATT